MAQDIVITDVATSGVCLANLAGISSAPSAQYIGKCFAFDEGRVSIEADQVGQCVHAHLLCQTIIGLWKEQCTEKVFVCYLLHPGMVRLFFCSQRKKYPAKFHTVLTQCAGYLECGQDAFALESIRPLAFWEPPCTSVALWPTGYYGETDGQRIVDTGNLLAYFSFEEESGCEEMEPEYIRIPTSEHSEFLLGKETYRYLNRWIRIADGQVAM